MGAAAVGSEERGGGPEGGDQPCPTAWPCWKNPEVLVGGRDGPG